MLTLLQFCLLLASFAISNGSIIYRAQCRSRCRTLYKGDQSPLPQCLAPCLENLAKLASCSNYCKSHQNAGSAAPCHYSCKYIKKLFSRGFLPGTCSTEKGDKYCTRNNECHQLTKCCYNYCQEISVKGEEVTVTVINVTSSSLLAYWQPSNIPGAVYIIQQRVLDSTTIHYTDYDWEKWKQMKQGGGISGIRVVGIHSGARLQLRVAVVNSSGLQSIGPATRVIQTLFNATPPSGPEQFWLHSETYKKNTVDINLSWQPPAKLDVPVHNYRLFWKEVPLVSSDHVVLTKQRTRVAGSQLNYTIQGLKQDKSYFVEIQAICMWKKKTRLKGPKVPLNVSTGHLKGTTVYFPNESKKKKAKRPNSSIFQDEEVKVEVLVEEHKGTPKPTGDNRSTGNRSTDNRRRSDIWTTMLLSTAVCLFVWWR